jgi:hypothetical protein
MPEFNNLVFMKLLTAVEYPMHAVGSFGSFVSTCVARYSNQSHLPIIAIQSLPTVG